MEGKEIQYETQEVSCSRPHSLWRASPQTSRLPMSVVQPSDIPPPHVCCPGRTVYGILLEGPEPTMLRQEVSLVWKDVQTAAQPGHKLSPPHRVKALFRSTGDSKDRPWLTSDSSLAFLILFSLFQNRDYKALEEVLPLPRHGGPVSYGSPDPHLPENGCSFRSLAPSVKPLLYAGSCCQWDTMR